MLLFVYNFSKGEISMREVIHKELGKMMQNAIDFLKHSEKNILIQPKYSAISFWSAIELILKYRICKEHWSLILSKPDLKKFLSGDFTSKYFDELCIILENIVGSPLEKPHKDVLITIKNHRNMWVHFYNKEDVEKKTNELIVDQLHGWFILNLYINKWSFYFKPYIEEINSIYQLVKNNNAQYLSIAYNYLTPNIQQKILADRGIKLVRCSVCRYISCFRPVFNIDVGFEIKCEVCVQEDFGLYHKCTFCKKPLLISHATSYCRNCRNEVSFDKSLEEINKKYEDLECPVYCMCQNFLITLKNGYYCTSCKIFIDASSIKFCKTCEKYGPDFNFNCAFCRDYEPDMEDFL